MEHVPPHRGCRQQVAHHGVTTVTVLP
ncbi:MAG TPA: PadR family transcriptional regulator, partial [Corynebacterium variabile]|nr:PadR family transcriptional regulator [Corynebacterium variabile]